MFPEASRTLEEFVDNLASYYASRGEGTGGLSKVLSGFTFLVLTVFVVQLFKDRQYIPLAMIALLGWTRFGALVFAASFVYFLTTKYWSGVMIPVAYFVISASSMYFGKRNVKKLLLRGAPMISPFENMPALFLALGLECLFLAFALMFNGIASHIFWALFVLVSLFHIVLYWSRLYPRYNQIHKPLMIRYASVAAREHVESEREGREFDFVRATHLLLETVFPDKPERAKEMVNRALDKMNSFADCQLAEDAIRMKHPRVNPSDVRRVLDEIADYLKTEEGRKLIVRYGIAEVVESTFGSEERGRYLWAVFTGEAP